VAIPRRKKPQPAYSDNVRILTIPDVGAVCVRFLGPIQGLLTHWIAGRPTPCVGPKDCPAKVHGSLTVWKGYAPALCWDHPTRKWIPTVAEVTESADESMCGHIRPGSTWILSRETPGDNRSKVLASFHEQYEGLLPSAFDIRPVLERRYHLSGLDLGVPNPTPPRVPAVPVDGPAPKGFERAAVPAPGVDAGNTTPPPTNPQAEAAFRKTVGARQPQEEKQATAEEWAKLREQFRSIGRGADEGGTAAQDFREQEGIAAAFRRGKLPEPSRNGKGGGK